MSAVGFVCKHSMHGNYYTGAETFAKEPKLVKLLREVKLTPVSYHHKIHWFYSYVRNPQLVVLLVLCCWITCKRVVFANMNVFFYWLA